MSKIEIERAPTAVSLQDAGRSGLLRYGVARAGPMDWARHAMANRMLGKDASSTVIELGPAGMDMVVKSGTLQISFAGPRYQVLVDGQPISSPMRSVLRTGQQLSIIPRPGAMWGYVGVQGSIQVPAYLGSQAENSVSGMRAVSLQQGVSISIADETPVSPHQASYIDPYIAYEHQPFGIIPSAQYHHFSDEMHKRFVSQALSIEARFDRMAYRLQGVQIYCDAGHDILSDSITMGAIQVPGDGQPFVLMADHQTTGGYPKIACVCMADLPRFAQMVPNKPIYFRWKTVEQALEAWSIIRYQIAAMQPLGSA